MLLNYFIIKFYKSRWKETVPHIYILLSSCDLIVGISALLNASTIVCYLATIEYNQTQSHVSTLLQISAILTYLISSIAIRVSAFINIVLAVARTINIISPFIQLKTSGMNISTIIYTLIWIGITSCDIPTIHARITSKNYSCENCLYMWHFIFSPLSGYWWVVKSPLIPDSMHQASEVFLAYIFFIVPFALPVFISVICMVIQSYYLLRKSDISDRHTSLIHRQVTKTITLTTSLFFFCYSTTAIVSISKFTQLSEIKNPDVGRGYYHLCYFLFSIISTINAAINPLILIIRGRSLRETTSATLKDVTRVKEPTKVRLGHPLGD